jgi:hypothetical protein
MKTVSEVAELARLQEILICVARRREPHYEQVAPGFAGYIRDAIVSR